MAQPWPLLQKDSPMKALHNISTSSLLCVGWIFFGSACTPEIVEPEIPAACQDDSVIDVGESPDPLARRGQIKLIERHFADGSEMTSVVGAKFLDFTQYNGGSQQAVELSASCVGMTGIPSRSDMHCEYTQTSCTSNADCDDGVDCRETDRLDVAAVHIEGLIDGPIDLDQQGVGSFVKAGLQRLYGDGLITIQLSASAASHSYVHNNGQLSDIPAPALLQPTAPSLDGNIQLRSEDLLLKWNPGADPNSLVYFDAIVPQQYITDPSQERNAIVSCVALDDGCLTFPAAAADWLLRPEPGWQNAGDVTVISSRRSKMSIDLSDDTADTQLDANLSVEFHGALSL